MLSNQILSSYEALRDEESRYIFRCRLMYLFNDDIREIYKIINYKSRMTNGEAICNNSNTLARLILNNCVSKDLVYIVGINRIGKLVYDYFKRVGINVTAFIDDGSEYSFDDMKVVELDQIDKTRKNKIVLAYNSKIETIKAIKKLLKNNIDMKDIICLQELGKKYFNEPFFVPTENEVFVDVGALDGKTILDFVEWCDNKYKKIYSFEPDVSSYKTTKETIINEQIRNVVLQNIGLWSKKTKLKFCGISSNGSMVSENGSEIIEVDKLDNIIIDEDVTFIKLDIEGSELRALQGAENIIKKNKPKLAISVYKNKRDILDILVYIHNLVPEYNLYLRHYSDFEYDTILYACV